MKRALIKKNTWTLIKRYKIIYLLMLIPIIEIIVFNYAPMYGIIVAFKKYKASRGIWGSDWVGLKWFNQFIFNPYFWKTFKNTFLLGTYSLLWSFPAPIILALLLNEIRVERFKKIVQTVTYLPYFISMVAICSMILAMLSPTTGAINQMLGVIGVQPIYFMTEARYFRTIYVASGIWQGVGWGTIIYLAALAGVDQELYEAATIDGANRFQKMWYISLSSIKPTISILLILSVPGIISANFEKVLLLYNEVIYDTADVMSTYLYRLAFGTSKVAGGQVEQGAAIGLFNSVISFALIMMSNRISKFFDNTASLW